MRIGILAVQGAFIEHEHMLTSLGCECVELRQKTDIHDLDGLILPGGESTVQGKLLHDLDMFNDIQALIANGLPTLATCAGLILLSSAITNDANTYFATMPVTVKRNAYGRQLGSFERTDAFGPLGDFTMTFIRAPYITEVANDVEVLATIDGNIVAAKYKNQIGLAFHPELGSDNRIHKYFIQLIEKTK